VDKIPQVRLNNGLVLPANRIVVEPILNLIVIDGVLAERILYFHAPLNLVDG